MKGDEQLSTTAPFLWGWSQMQKMCTTRTHQIRQPTEARNHWHLQWLGRVKSVLRKDKTQIHWTSTENMLIDCGTKGMKSDHLKAVLHQGTWSMTYNPRFVKQTTKPLKAAAPKGLSLPGRLLSADDPMLSHLMRLAERPGWHFQDPHGIHVCRNARSFRGPAPRFNAESFPSERHMLDSTPTTKLSGESWRRM